MYPSGTIYHIYTPEKSGSHGEVRLHATFATKVLYNLVRGIGAGVIGFVIIAFLFTFGPLLKEEVKYDLYRPSPVDLVNAQNTSLIQNEAKSFGVNSYF